MGIYSSCYSTSSQTGSAEYAVLELYDEEKAREVASVEYPTNPGFDDVMGEPYLVDQDLDGLGERVRPSVTVLVKAQLKAPRYEEQNQTQAGNSPDSLITLTLFEQDLTTLGLLVDGVCEIRPNDRLLRIQDGSGNVRAEFAHGGREGLYCVEVRPGETGTGTFVAVFESRRAVA